MTTTIPMTLIFKKTNFQKMKKHFIAIIVFIVCFGISHAQINSVLEGPIKKPTDFENICSKILFNSFASDRDAELALDKILQAVGLSYKNNGFQIIPCSNIPNAGAFTDKQGIKYIFYNRDFMSSIANSNSNWVELSILCHEVGHHLANHPNSTVTTPKNVQQQRELEADEYLGYIMYKLGASLQQAHLGMRKIAVEEDDTYSTHPKLSRRLEAISNGYKKAGGSDRIVVDNRRTAESYFSEGNKLYLEGKYQEAIDKYSKAIEIKPNYSVAYSNRGAAKKVGFSQNENAINDYNKAIQIDSKNSDAFANRAIAKYDKGDYQGAYDDANKTVELNPDDLHIFPTRLSAALMLGNYYSVISDANTLIENNYTENGVIIYYFRGYAYLELEKYSSAIQDFNKTIELSPQHEMAFFNRGVAKLNLGQDGCRDILKAKSLARSNLSGIPMERKREAYRNIETIDNLYNEHCK
jgi:tetratricopeptide (TPR) repeat protein